jgi:hypothetical protein
MKRVTIVASRAGGRAHPFEYRKLSEHFMLSLPEARSVNPITGKDWKAWACSRRARGRRTRRWMRR